MRAKPTADQVACDYWDASIGEKEVAVFLDLSPPTLRRISWELPWMQLSKRRRRTTRRLLDKWRKEKRIAAPAEDPVKGRRTEETTAAT